MSKDMHLGLRVLRVQGEGCRRCVFLIRVLHPQCYTPVTLRAVTPRVGGRQNFNIFTRQESRVGECEVSKSLGNAVTVGLKGA